ncbi:molybdopterin-dependent oxidoreductase [Robiginitalea sp. M366]|uniref:xanthine dehydrogenase family protein molybdopterin-binding subunit n=1 Tax=Robiginitalea aestuariiviva TaxID=3036903 RepID=UPI00240D0316|nr:molybdopterin cofactor-binding domain-containing protein [Robiginitalea aestuariiviva]MDG1571156.1 molybdopterin-dependent oxidoreductase [Robiginitalea aestuariiviva]
MTRIKTTLGRRAFIKNTSLAGGGLVLGFSWLNACKPEQAKTMAVLEMPEEWFEINAYLKIGDNGLATIFSPNPEFGQNVITSMPMIVAEELGIAWEKVLVEQAPFHVENYGRQFTGGSQGIRRAWEGLRMAGASARHMLRQAAANAWAVSMDEITTQGGMLHHAGSGKSAHYGEMAAAAAQLEVPEEIELKTPADFNIIGHSKKNVRGHDIVTGKPIFGVDYTREGMLIAMPVFPPAFGMTFKSMDAEAVKAMPGIRDVFTIETLEPDYQRSMFDTTTFEQPIIIVGETTWAVMQAKKALHAQWEPFEARTHTVAGWGGAQEVTIPAGLENTRTHREQMEAMDAKPGKVARKDGDPETAFKNAAKVVERTYSCPFLAHNCMEPMNFFAHVTEEKAELAGPLQAPEFIENTLAARLGMPKENIDIHMTRMGGGFGRRAYSTHAVEAALVSRKMNAPVRLMYSREDDMGFGIYRPSYFARFKAALDADNNLVGYTVKAGGIPESPLFANRFPAGAVDHYLAEEWDIPSNITIGAFRAPRSNFMAGAEQSFLDEVAETAGKDPIAFRLELLEKAKTQPVGETNDYDPERYAGVLELVREKSGWDTLQNKGNRGVSAYFCHNSYAAHVLELSMENGKPRVEKVTCALDCGIVINPDAAVNMAEGAIVDGVGNTMFGEMTFTDGRPDKRNFDTYRMIRMTEAPRDIQVHFVQNEIAPTGLGEPPFPPIFGAFANALYKATGQRQYHQPFVTERPLKT